MRIVEILVFTGLAAGAHLSLWAVSPTLSGASGAAGSDASGPVSVATASVEQTALAAAWQRPPVAEQAILPGFEAPVPEDAARSPGARLYRAPSMPTAVPSTPQALPSPRAPVPPRIDTSSAPPPAPKLSRPKARPTPQPTRTAAAPTPQVRTEKTAGGGLRQPPNNRADTSTLNSADAARSNALRAQWGAAIYAKVRRKMRYPANAGAEGTARVALQIASNGSLQNLRLTRSSGSALLDRAALHAVSQAGRFDRAPKGLAGDVHRFSLSLTFTR